MKGECPFFVLCQGGKHGSPALPSREVHASGHGGDFGDPVVHGLLVPRQEPRAAPEPRRFLEL